MIGIAQELDATLRRIDAHSAQRIERLVREILVLAELPCVDDESGPSLLELSDHSEPMGVLTNAEIDRAIYGG
jgi:hypothetical protein